MSKILQLLSKGEIILIGSTSGTETIASAKEVFHGINMSFDKLRNICDIPTKETPADVYQVMEDSTYIQIFNDIASDQSKLFLTQNQVIEFCKEYSSWFNGWMYIPFKAGNQQKMAYARKHRDEITIHESDFHLKVKIEAWRKSRIVIPQINL